MIPIPGAGPEDVLPELEGVIFGLTDGRILRLESDGAMEVLVNTGGRPLGLDRLPDGRLLVCDADRGLLAVDTTRSEGGIEVLCDRVEDRPLGLCNNAAVAPDGTIWFTSSSDRYGLSEVVRDIVENTRSGRLFRLPPGGRVEVALEGLGFANGVAVLPDPTGDRVLVAATGEAAIHALRVSGPEAGRRDMFATGLPMMPDNLSVGTDGLVWVAGPSRTDPALAVLHRLPRPFRRAVGRIAAGLGARARPVVGAMAFDRAGTMIHRFEDRHPAFSDVTGVREMNGTLWLGSLDRPAIARCDILR